MKLLNGECFFLGTNCKLLINWTLWVVKKINKINKKSQGLVFRGFTVLLIIWINNKIFCLRYLFKYYFENDLWKPQNLH